MGGCGCCKSKKSQDVSVNDIKKAIESNEKLFIWILGGPGSGKGTQCKMLSLHYKLAHLSTGDLLRQAVTDDTPLAKEIKQVMESGGLVNTNIVLELLLDAMRKAFETCNGFLIDGYPREVEQGVMLCEKIGYPHLIIYLECPDSVLEERLLKRGEESGRVDDNKEAIQSRLKTFHDVSEPVLGHWKDKVKSIDGTLSPANVESECTQAIEDMQMNLKKA